jgi:hypothetical protein
LNNKNKAEAKPFELAGKKVGFFSYRQNRGLQIEIDGIHSYEDLLIFMRQPRFFPKCGFAKILHPSMFAQKGGGQAQW